MAFKFQINPDIRFIHDEALLAKADACRPVIHARAVRPRRLVCLQQDPGKYMGWGVCEDERKSVREDERERAREDERGSAREDERRVEALPERVLRRGDRVILDFGRHCVGHFSVDIRKSGCAMDAPLYLRVRLAEVCAELAEEPKAYEGWLSRSWIQEEYLHLDVLPARLELPRRYSFRFVELTVIDTSPKWGVTFANPQAECLSAAEEEKQAIPLPADERLRAICEVSVRTLAECMQDVFEDGPKRDRRLWLGDLRLQALANYATFDNAALVKRCLYLFAAMATEDGRLPACVFTSQAYEPDDTFLFDYSLFFISALHDYLQVHEDPELLRDLYPVCVRQMNAAWESVGADGALHCGEDCPVFIDWSNDFNKDTAGQAVLIYVLRQFLTLGQMAGDPACAPGQMTGNPASGQMAGVPNLALWQTRLDRLTAYAMSELFDADRHLFVSGPDRELNAASQVWMVLANVAGEAENRRIMEETVKNFFPVRGIATPYMYHHIAEALFAAGLKTEALDLIRAYWGGMIDLGADTFWESYQPDMPDYSPYGSTSVLSYCHAWSCTPVYLLRRYAPEVFA